MKMKLSDISPRGEWVQDYTRRGSPRQGARHYRWRSYEEKMEERLAGVGFIAGMLMLLVLVAYLNT